MSPQFGAQNRPPIPNRNLITYRFEPLVKPFDLLPELLAIGLSSHFETALTGLVTIMGEAQKTKAGQTLAAPFGIE